MNASQDLKEVIIVYLKFHLEMVTLMPGYRMARVS